MTTQEHTTERTAIATCEVGRTRPRWARIVRHFGEDLCWAINGWTGFPRATRRAAAGVAGTTAGWLMGFQDIPAQIVEMLGR